MAEPKAAMQRHHTHDWCHLCGERSDLCVDIWYSDNAEHDPPTKPGHSHPLGKRHYIRVCGMCGARIAAVAGVLVET